MLSIAHNYKVNGKQILGLEVKVNNITNKHFVAKGDLTYHLFLDEPELSLQMTLLNKPADFIRKSKSLKGKKRSYQEGNIELLRNQHNTYSLLILVDHEKIEQNNFDIYYSSSNLIIEGEIKIDNKSILSKRKRAFKKVKNEVKKEEKQKRINKLVQSFEAYEQKIQKTKTKTSFKPNREKSLASKGIYKAKSKYKQCKNCANLSDQKCIYHYVQVDNDHACRKFYPYKVYSGGGFSPK